MNRNDRACKGRCMIACGGYTLVESMITVAILLVLLGIVVPGFNVVAARTRASSAMLELRALLESARQAAVSTNREITFCGTPDGTRCSHSWREAPALVFHDADQDRQADGNEQIVAMAQLAGSGSIRWRASGGRNYLRFKPDGSVREYGSFVYCPPDLDTRMARAVIVAATGRIRNAQDRNRDGIVEDASGQAVRCEV